VVPVRWEPLRGMVLLQNGRKTLKDLTNSAIYVLHNHAVLMQLLCGEVKHQELEAEAAKLKELGVSKEQVDAALFRVETLHNIAV
jgi:hypothetical protein